MRFFKKSLLSNLVKKKLLWHMRLTRYLFKGKQMAPNTINDLPIENNERWAQAQKDLETGPRIQEGRHVVGPAQVDVTEPSYPSAIAALVGQGQANIPWAIIEPPAIYTTRRSDLFTEQLAPRLGDNPKLELIKNRLESLPETHHGR